MFAGLVEVSLSICGSKFIIAGMSFAVMEESCLNGLE